MGDHRDALARLVEEPFAFLDDGDVHLRRLAVSACARHLTDEVTVGRLLAIALSDPDPAVRAEAVEVVAGAGAVSFDTLVTACGDADARVVEAAATGLGELEDDRTVPVLVELARDHGDRLVREAAVAALGAIGDPAGLPVLLDLVSTGPPQVRRRCVAALTVFDDPAALDAIRAARDDRNPMVKEAALMAIGYDDPPGSG